MRRRRFFNTKCASSQKKTKLLKGDPFMDLISSNRSNCWKCCWNFREMLDQMELLSRKPQIMSKSSKCFSMDQILNFKNPFLYFYAILGLAGWTVTFFNLISRLSENSHLSPTCPDSVKVLNLYEWNFSFDLHVFVSEDELNYARESELVWRKPGLTYGDLRSIFNFRTNLSVSEVGSASPMVISFDKWILFETKPKSFLFSTPETMAASICTSV